MKVSVRLIASTPALTPEQQRIARALASALVREVCCEDAADIAGEDERRTAEDERRTANEGAHA